MDDELKLRKTTEEDYPELVSWWNWWPVWEPIPQEVLPDNGRNGVMISYKGQNVCAGFIYATSSPVLFHIEWIISNPKVKDREVRRLALILLIDSISKFIKEAGGKYIYTSLKNESLVKYYEECGYEKGSTGTIEMIKKLP